MVVISGEKSRGFQRWRPNVPLCTIARNSLERACWWDFASFGWARHGMVTEGERCIVCVIEPLTAVVVAAAAAAVVVAAVVVAAGAA